MTACPLPLFLLWTHSVARYKDMDAIAKHKETPHYKMWAKFKEEGNVLTQTVLKMDVQMGQKV